MKIYYCAIATIAMLSAANGFIAVSSSPRRSCDTSTGARFLAAHEDDDDSSSSFSSSPELDRRSAMTTAAAAVLAVAGGAATSFLLPIMPSTTTAVAVAAAAAAETKTVVVAGATGQTGRRVLERLAATPGWSVVAGVRNVDKASKSLAEASTVVRGAMIQKVDLVDITTTSARGGGGGGVNLQHLDIVMDSADQLTETLKGADSLVIAVGFIPGNPLKMNDEAHKVDNLGTVKLIDAAKAAGVQKVVMVSSILTNGRNWGQEKSPGFVITNAFGKVLDEKIVAENYLRASGLDYTIVRPGGLKAQPPSGPLVISGEDTLNSGEISRDLVADVCVASLTDAKASNKVLEIIEDDGKPPQVFNGLQM